MKFTKHLYIVFILFFSLSYAQDVDDENTNSIVSVKSFKPNSILKDGDWYKISVASDGVYKIDYEFIQNELKINPNSINFGSFGVFGQAMGILPEYNGTARVDDLDEIGIKIKDLNNNGTWDADDYILFYAKGPHLWNYDKNSNSFSHQFNIYTEVATYFVSPNKGTGKLIDTENAITSNTAAITEFDDWYFYEEDVNNLIYSELSGGQGSGRKWFGRLLNNIDPEQEINFNIPNIISNQAAQINAHFVALSKAGNSNFQASINGNQLFSKLVGPVTGSENDPIAIEQSYSGLINNPSSNMNIQLKFSSNNSQAKGWLDYVEIVAKRALSLNTSYILFRSFASLDNTTAKYKLSNANSNTEIWDVSQGSNIKKITGNLTGTSYEFATNSNILREFVAINVSSSNFEKPKFVSAVNNQNLHALSNIDYVIISNEALMPAAEKLANFHRINSGLTVTTVLLDQIYNEFSSGQQDLTAIRDFLKMFHDRNASYQEKLKYVLLMGDASFDYKNRIENNQNQIPTFESTNSLTSVETFCTDDFIGFLDDDEGLNMDNNLSADLDIAIGRIPVNSLNDAQGIVDKIIHYKTNKSTNGWKNELSFVADDEDGNLHLNDSEEILGISGIENIDYYNIDKIYLDAYDQFNSAGGDRYPDVVDAILRKLFTGTFFIDYTGHGGPTNWAQERVFNIQDIRNLDNKDKLPLFMTATCDFSPFDNPTIVSAGEELLLNPNGGAIAMLSTTRLVYAFSNKQMNKAVLNFLFEEVNGRMPTIGEILLRAKNQAGSNRNNRKFVLLGDPALTLEYPKNEIVTTKINGKSILEEDTLKALSRVSIEGGIMNVDGSLMTDFNGKIYVNVYDKESTYTTKANDVGESVSSSFKLRNNAIFKGQYSVVNGRFEVAFIVPKDINYSFGNGKITYYAEKDDDPTVDAHGYSYNFKVGGTDENFVPDDEGPEVLVYMNDTNFVYGGITNENPILLVKLKDKSGINTIGNGVGHDIVGVLDENTQNQYLLNDFYTAELNNFTKGNIKFLLNDIEDGTHQIKVKAWDVHNNSGEGYTEFVVASSAELAIDNVLNYPNPFINSTSFVFEHNQPGEPLDISIEIYTSTGKRIKTINAQLESEGYRIGPNQITWDGLDNNGNYIGRGIYLYKVNVKGINGYNVYKFEKLVILK